LYADLHKICEENSIPLIVLTSSENYSIKRYVNEIQSIKPDIILAIGWYYKIPKSILDIPKYGTWGIHASLLPKYAGGAPLVWAIINGEKETGVTLFRLDEGMDSGDIIYQKKFIIKQQDTIKEVYNKAIKVSKEILIKALKDPDNIVFKPQDKNKLEYWPQRSPENGLIDFSRPGIEIYNFIRAQVPPYPGAFFRTHDGYKIFIDKCRIEKDNDD
jgi:methionyl-tRNA formyltransferase